MKRGLVRTVQKFRAGLRERGGLHFFGAARLAEEQQHPQEHQEDAERGHAKDVLHPQALVHIGRDVGAGGAADIHQRVVDGVSDGAHVFFGGARCGADHAGLHQRDAERGQGQHKGDENDQRHGVADRSKPRGAERSQQKISAAQDEVGQRKRAAEAHAVGERSAEDGQKPHQAAEESGERAGLLDGEMQDFVEIARQRSEGSVVGEPLEQLADVGDPEGPLEARCECRATAAQSSICSPRGTSCQ